MSNAPQRPFHSGKKKLSVISGAWKYSGTRPLPITDRDKLAVSRKLSFPL